MKKLTKFFAFSDGNKRDCGFTHHALSCIEDRSVALSEFLLQAVRCEHRVNAEL
jgi:hypothetical protein